MGHSDKDAVRIDKWLWAARCFKTRSLASKACADGQCEVDGAVVKASGKVRPGQTVQVQTPGGLRVLEVVGLAEKRGPASFAETLYVDHTPPPEPRDPMERLLADAPTFRREKGSGRPTKRDRRHLSRTRGDIWEPE